MEGWGRASESWDLSIVWGFSCSRLSSSSSLAKWESFSSRVEFFSFQARKSEQLPLRLWLIDFSDGVLGRILGFKGSYSSVRFVGMGNWFFGGTYSTRGGACLFRLTWISKRDGISFGGRSRCTSKVVWRIGYSLPVADSSTFQTCVFVFSCSGIPARLYNGFLHQISIIKRDNKTSISVEPAKIFQAHCIHECREMCNIFSSREW